MTDKTVKSGSDGVVSITLSEDKMEALASFYPSTGIGRKLEFLQAESALKANGIKVGIDKKAILESIDKCNLEQVPVKDVIVARGKKPLKASPEHINLKPDFFNKAKTVLRKDGSVNYKESSPFVMVKKGEAVGRIYSYRGGINGQDVTGGEIPYKTKDMQIFKIEENLEIRDEILYSMVYGRFLIIGDLISVTEVLEIGTDVDYHTGNVSFAGDVIIEGVIHDGFRVAAGGSIRCKKNIMNSEVLSRGDLQLDLGVKGRGNALLRINGMIYSKFIELGTIESRTGISISTSILSSNVYTLGNLTMGQKGIIVSSNIIAEKGIEVFNLGRELCAPSTIWCGISFVENRKLDHLHTRHNVLLDKISALESKKEPPLDLVEQMKKAAAVQLKEIEQLEQDMCTFKEAKIIVHGTLFSGTVIKICNLRKKIEKDEKRVSISVDRERNELKIEPIL
jgi:uncharacterized protein (DUF342 family)